MIRALVVFLIAFTSSPAAAQAPDRIARGAEVYAEFCLECHGPTATEGESGDIRGLGRATLTGAVRSGLGMMPAVPLTTEEISAVAAYLDHLYHEH